MTKTNNKSSILLKYDAIRKVHKLLSVYIQNIQKQGRFKSILRRSPFLMFFFIFSCIHLLLSSNTIFIFSWYRNIIDANQTILSDSQIMSISMYSIKDTIL